MDKDQRAAIEAARRTVKRLARHDKKHPREQTADEGVCYYGEAGAETLGLAFAWATTHRLLLQPVRPGAAPVVIEFARVSGLELAGDRAEVTEDDGRKHSLQFGYVSPSLSGALRAGVNVAHGRHWND